jgi:hypothetical protein
MRGSKGLGMTKDGAEAHWRGPSKGECESVRLRARRSSVGCGARRCATCTYASKQPRSSRDVNNPVIRAARCRSRSADLRIRRRFASRAASKSEISETRIPKRVWCFQPVSGHAAPPMEIRDAPDRSCGHPRLDSRRAVPASASLSRPPSFLLVLHPSYMVSFKLRRLGLRRGQSRVTLTGCSTVYYGPLRFLFPPLSSLASSLISDRNRMVKNNPDAVFTLVTVCLPASSLPAPPPPASLTFKIHVPVQVTD